MKRSFALLMLALLLTALLCGCSKAPDNISLKTDAVFLSGSGDSYDMKLDVLVDGNSSATLVYTSSDTSVAEVSKEGVISAKGLGFAVVTVSAKADSSKKASLDVLVSPYQGVYTASKYIEAMHCDIRVRIVIGKDGYEYYRYPMVVALDGAGQMPDLADKGSYEVNGSEFVFASELLGDYSLKYSINDGTAMLSGSVPTGGAKTQMQLLLNSSEDRGESGIYSGKGEVEDGTQVGLSLDLSEGAYRLSDASGKTISEGTYTFEGDSMEFAAQNGPSFTADYSQARNVVEGMQLPTGAEEDAPRITITLSRE